MTGWIFLGVAIVWSLAQGIALARNTDKNLPTTYYVRKIIGTPFSVVWFLALGLLLWLPCHFLLYYWIPC